jgi:hypothetical protein
LVKLLGLAAAVGLAPKLLAGASGASATAPAKDSAVLELRPESRAVARRDDTV